MNQKEVLERVKLISNRLKEEYKTEKIILFYWHLPVTGSHKYSLLPLSHCPSPEKIEHLVWMEVVG